MSRIGMFGGTFAPFHRGHRRALEEFLRLAELDFCYVIPSGTPPHKVKTALFTDEERLWMTKAACEDLEKVTVSDWELARTERSYTALTLGWLKDRHPHDTLVLYVGSDMFLTLQDWYQPQTIFSLAEIAAFSRTGEDWEVLTAHKTRLETEFDGVKATVHTVPPFPVSSTEIREKRENGEDISDLVPPSVLHCLTLLDWKNELQKTLSPHRFAHSLGVMKEAEVLAKLHGADKEKARIAGLLHDMTKESPKEEHFRLFEKYGLNLDENLKTNKNLWHAWSASAAVQEKYRITDPEIVGAIRYHTTGKAEMTVLEQVLYMADLTDETRTYDDVDFYRALAHDHLEKACLLALEWCRDDVARRGFPVHDDMLKAIAFYRAKYPDITEDSEQKRLHFCRKG